MECGLGGVKGAVQSLPGEKEEPSLTSSSPDLCSGSDTSAQSRRSQGGSASLELFQETRKTQLISDPGAAGDIAQ